MNEVTELYNDKLSQIDQTTIKPLQQWITEHYNNELCYRPLQQWLQSITTMN